MKIMQIKRRVDTPNSETCTKNSTMYYCIINAMEREREKERDVLCFGNEGRQRNWNEAVGWWIGESIFI
jgi:hypothetical protein